MQPELWRQSFHEDLDGDGGIRVAGEIFLRRNILSNLSPGTYKTAFEEWCENRTAELIEKADGFLQRFDTANRFAQLKQAYHTSNVIPFVGAGMSTTTGYLGWTALLRQLRAESTVDEEPFEAVLSSGDYEGAAQLIYDDLGSPSFNEHLENAYRQDHIPDGPVLYMPIVFPKSSVITTNFDRVIEQLYKADGSNPFSNFSSGRSLAEVLRRMAGGTRLLVKMHGDCHESAGRVLLSSEYVTAYGNTGIVEQFFDGVLLSRTLLFLGCGLANDRTVRAMQQFAQRMGAAGATRHYAFLQCKRGTDYRQIARRLSSSSIFPIWYDGAHDEAIEALLVKLYEPD